MEQCTETSVPVSEITSDNCWKIRSMYLSDDAEDKEIAYKWLCQLIGVRDAKANLFILTFYKDWNDDSDCIIDENNWYKMMFKTYPTSFGKNYHYRVLMIAKFEGVEIMNDEKDYARFAVANGDPKFDFCHYLCEAFRKLGYTFIPGLFAKPATNVPIDV